MASQKTAHLFLIDGTPNGRIKCSLSNWIGKVYLIPRTEIERSKNRVHLNQTGVYLLFGTEADTGEQFLYVGQAKERQNGKGVLGRVVEHIGDEHLDYFTHVVCIIDSENSFGPTDVSYLENAFHQLAMVAGRVKLKNKSIPSPANVTEEQRAALDDFILNAKILIGTLGYRVFDAVDDVKQPELSQSTGPVDEAEPTLYLNAAEANGTGRQSTDGFVLFAGSKLRAEMTGSVPAAARENRFRYSNRVNSAGELQRDTLFGSPSAAASFLLGTSVNGRVVWKNDSGQTLREIEESEAKAVAETF
ncbi:hypothetical protein JOE56_002097 [Brevibacterium paucivorans]|uniref:DUF4357 domain-containing protein n=1 Tax=Brevibacterium paucivorans TaxID=170994 RepID=A0ABS2SQ74_9MICO|nr:hypothetical protein [Brevibacterium paucivorans]